MSEKFAEINYFDSEPIQPEQEISYKETLPGSEQLIDEIRDPSVIVEPEKETSWVEDKDVSKFMEYINQQYPANIPKHDGKSTLGCERAILFLESLNREISVAIRLDTNFKLDIAELEKIRSSIMKDIVILKEHLRNLKSELLTKANVLDKNIKKMANKLVPEDLRDIEYAWENQEPLEKIAHIPRMQIVITPFERAISGIIINAVISGGKPFDTVFEYMKDKYKLTEREELSLYQILMDSGYSIFKDRGTIGEEKDSEPVEFIKTYFA